MVEKKKIVVVSGGPNTPIQEKTGSCMEARPKGPSAFAAPGGKNKRLSKKVSRPSK